MRLVPAPTSSILPSVTLLCCRRCLFGADAAEAFDGERGEVRASAYCCRGLLRGRPGGFGVLEDTVECVAAIAGGKDEAAPVLRNQAAGNKAVVDKASQLAVHNFCRTTRPT